MNIPQNSIFVLLVVVLLCAANSATSQSVIGFWEVKEVMVGEKNVTPVAKWFKIDADGSYTAGNGWLQNAEGTWKYDPRTNTYLPSETNGLKDPFGAFKISFEGKETMRWERDEEGMPVIVTLTRTEKMPRSTADILVGVWDLTDVRENGASVMNTFDPNDSHYIFIRWDRIYVARTPDRTRTTGYWHIDGHKPEVTFISHDETKTPERWRVTVNDVDLQMEGISEQNKSVIRVYKRVNEFPK